MSQQAHQAEARDRRVDGLWHAQACVYIQQVAPTDLINRHTAHQISTPCHSALCAQKTSRVQATSLFINIKLALPVANAASTVHLATKWYPHRASYLGMHDARASARATATEGKGATDIMRCRRKPDHHIAAGCLLPGARSVVGFAFAVFARRAVEAAGTEGAALVSLQAIH